jgi:D-alanine transaminase
MSRIAYVNGRYRPSREASVNIEDRGYQFADGVYEVVYLHAGRPVDETLHLDRMDRSLRELQIALPMSRAALRHVMGEMARRNRIADGLLYIQVTRGVARRDHVFPARSVPPAIVVTARRLAPFPAAIESWAAKAITCRDERWARCDIKSVGLLANVLAKQKARERGAIEAILYDAAEFVTEGASTNVWIVDKSSVLRTRALDHHILPGCTRGALITLLQAGGISFAEQGFSLETLRSARELFITSATNFIRPITRLDDEPVGEGTVGPVTRLLFDLLARHVRGGAALAA